MARTYKKTVVSARRCILPKGAEFAGDHRYRYKNWWCLTPSEKRDVSRRYTYNTAGIPDKAYAYPITASGRLANARRMLVWNLRNTRKRTARMRVH